MALSHQASYTNWQTAAGQKILMPTFADWGMSRGQCGGTPMAVNLSFLDRSSYFFSQVATHLSSQGWGDSVPDPILLRKSGSAGNQNGDLWVYSQELWPLDHRGGLQSINWMIKSGYIFLSNIKGNMLMLKHICMLSNQNGQPRTTH
jgi:hypothetical protein